MYCQRDACSHPVAPCLPRRFCNAHGSTAMVAIVSGNSLGLELGSLRTLDPGGVFGSAATGRSGEQVYVNAANGNLVIQDRDEVLAGRGDDAVLWRTYNSQGLSNDDNGDNWISGTVLQPLALAGTLGTAGSTLARTDKDGSSAVYSWDAARTAYVTREGDGACDTIVLAGGQLEWRDGTTGARQRYEASGAYRLLASIDTAGNSLTYGYNAAGRLASATTANGETTWYDYAGNNLAQVRTVRADATTTTRVRYGYDASNRLTTVTVDLTPDDNSIADGKTYQTSYSYDGASQRVASITQSDGTSLSIGYVSYGGLWRVASITNALGQVTQFSFSSGLLRVTDPLGVLIEYRSASGRLISIYNPRSGTEQRFDWNATGDLLRSMDPEGRATVYDYDANGNRRWERDDAGNTVDRTFDARDQLLTETRWLVADPDGGGPTLPSNPSTTRYAYEGSRNLLRFVVTAEGRVTEYRYNAFGQQVAEIGYTAGFYPVSGLAPDAAISESGLALWAAAQDASAAQRTDTTWDARGQMQARTTFARLDASGAGVVDGTQTVERFVHDQAGRLLQTISGTGATTVSTWDGLGRRLSTTDAAGKTQVVQYQDSARKIVLALGGGLVQTSLYDTAGQLVSVVDSNSAGILLGETRRFYDAVGNLRMTQDPAGVRRWLLYDTLGRQTGEVDGSGSLTESVFDKSGLVTKTIAYATPVNLAA
ncbi:MAG: RHS repeat protein, partial [Comamonadaceae bacterium]